MFIPKLLHRVCVFLELRESHARHLCVALRHSRWSRPQAWARELQTLEHSGMPLADVMCEEALRPVVVVQVVEDLVAEKRLSRLSALLITEAILRQVDSQGRWVGMPPSAGRAVTLPAEMSSWVHHYWR
jgi:uncharacterized protein YecE (DUF72 family)